MLWLYSIQLHVNVANVAKTAQRLRQVAVCALNLGKCWLGLNVVVSCWLCLHMNSCFGLAVRKKSICTSCTLAWCCCTFVCLGKQGKLVINQAQWQAKVGNHNCFPFTLINANVQIMCLSMSVSYHWRLWRHQERHINWTAVCMFGLLYYKHWSVCLPVSSACQLTFSLKATIWGWSVAEADAA